MSKITTIEQLHAEWEAAVMPMGAPDMQRNAMRSAFYSGCSAMIALMIGQIAELPDDEAEAALTEVQEEIVAYAATHRSTIRRIPSTKSDEDETGS